MPASRPPLLTHDSGRALKNRSRRGPKFSRFGQVLRSQALPAGLIARSRRDFLLKMGLQLADRTTARHASVGKAPRLSQSGAVAPVEAARAVDELSPPSVMV